jgi:hypothetical protein
MKQANNWISSGNHQPLSAMDQVKELLRIKHKLVLVQVHELERLRGSRRLFKYTTYIKDLHNHYIVNNGDKTYLNN